MGARERERGSKGGQERDVSSYKVVIPSFVGHALMTSY
jgi:hypothetical protein